MWEGVAPTGLSVATGSLGVFDDPHRPRPCCYWVKHEAWREQCGTAIVAENGDVHTATPNGPCLAGADELEVEIL